VLFYNRTEARVFISTCVVHLIISTTMTDKISIQYIQNRPDRLYNGGDDTFKHRLKYLIYGLILPKYSLTTKFCWLYWLCYYTKRILHL